MNRRALKVLCLLALVWHNFACQKTLSNSAENNNTATFTTAPDAEKSGARAPFAAKEPEKYRAKIVFTSQLAIGAANYLEQTYFVARDGANRRLDFEIGAHAISHLQLADGKQFVVLPKQKVFAELKIGDEKLLTNQPAEFTLEHLLHTQPPNAAFQRIGVETLAGRETVKYRLDYENIQSVGDARTETIVWADENLGLPIKTEVVALENNAPSGARSVMELREIATEVEPNLFDVPKDFRRITFAEARKIVSSER